MKLVPRLLAAAALALMPALALAQGAVPALRVPTKPANDNSTNAASTAYVDQSAQILLNAVSSRLSRTSNLSDLASPSAARGNLGLGGAATLNVGTGAGQVLTGDADHSGVAATVPGVTGVVARSLAARALDTINVRDFGAVGDGVTNDFTAVQKAAISRGKDVFVPAGTYLVTLSSGVGIGTFPAGTVIRGAGRDVSKIVIKTSSTAYLNAFSVAATGLRFEDVSIDFQLVPGQIASLFLMNGCSNVVFDRVRLTSNVGVVYSTPGNLATGSTTTNPYLWNVGGDCSDVEVRNSEISGWFYTVLKTNASTGTQRRWSFSGNHFFGNVTSHLSPNSPSGVWDGFQITGNTFGNLAPTSTMAGQSHMIGFATIQNVQIAGNRFVGVTGGEAIHIEENSRNITISGNTADISSPFAGWGKFVQITDNNISGTRYTPSNISITGNVARRSDGVLDGVGIDAPYDGSGQSGVQGLIVDGNTLDGFATGVSVPELSLGSRVANNTIRNCTTGLSAFSGSTDVRDNSFEACTTGIAAQRGGLFGRQRFASVLTLASSSGGIVGLRGWSQAFETSTTGAQSLLRDLGVIGRRFNGTFRVLLSAGSAIDSDTAEYAASWDGSAITQTKGWNYAGGGVASLGTGPFSVQNVSPFNLRVAPFVNAARPNVTFTVEFDGIQLF